jgi:flagellar biosynthesis chaperone FliJ
MGNETSSTRSSSNRALPRQQSTQSTQPTQSIDRRIVVVNDRRSTIETKQPEDELVDQIRLLQFSPLITIGSETVPPNLMHVNHIPFSNICRLLQKLLRLKAQSVQSEQNQLADLVREIDFAAAYLASGFVDRERRLQRVLDAFGRLNQIVSSVSRCEQHMKQLEQQVNQLNQQLPVEQRLEQFSTSST